MTRPFALTLSLLLLLAACSDEEEKLPPPACEIGVGHLCGERAPGVECPPRYVCDGRVCTKACTEDAMCVTDICKGKDCEESYQCLGNGDPSPGASDDGVCSQGPQLYACVDVVGECPDTYYDFDGWCIQGLDLWYGTGF